MQEVHERERIGHERIPFSSERQRHKNNCSLWGVTEKGSSSNQESKEAASTDKGGSVGWEFGVVRVSQIPQYS